MKCSDGLRASGISYQSRRWHGKRIGIEGSTTGMFAEIETLGRLGVFSCQHLSERYNRLILGFLFVRWKIVRLAENRPTKYDHSGLLTFECEIHAKIEHGFRGIFPIADDLA